MCTFKTLTITNWEPYRHLTFPSLSSVVEKLWGEERLHLVGVAFSGTPVGLAVLEYDEGKQVGYMHSLFIAKKHRRRGLATQLLNRIRYFCKEYKIRLIRFVYYAQNTVPSPARSWLIRQGGNKHEIETLIFHIDHRISQAPWIRERAVPAGLQLLPWKHIEDSELEKLHSDERYTYPSFLSPFKSFAPMELTNSFGLLSASGIEGWSISYRIRKDTILYDALYVVPEYQFTGLPLMMLSKAIRLHLEKIEQIPFGLFAVNCSTPHMFNMAQKWIRPYAIKVSEKRYCDLPLT